MWYSDTLLYVVDAPVELLDEKTASAVNILQQIINMQNQVSYCDLLCYLFYRGGVLLRLIGHADKTHIC